MSAALDYPLSLAVEDFVPVVLTGAGAALLTSPLRRFGAGRGRAGTAGAALVFLGGLSKAAWKLIVALDGPDIVLMNKALFPTLSAGFLLLAYALPALNPEGGPGPENRRRPPLWAWAALWAAVGAAGLALRSTAPSLVLTIAAVTLVGVRLILLARTQGDIPAAAAGGLWLTGMYALGPLAARPDQTVALQWIEQSANTATQAAFLFAAWRLVRRYRRVSPSPTPSGSAA
ncbi:hypothetical protein [Streptomyces sp. NPDC058701]|uniref:hypothetical protein n=1 Tax=Streptomyces sp. NPDC058701 TaxID=3346608 RepID=UPI0036563494